MSKNTTVLRRSSAEIESNLMDYFCSSVSVTSDNGVNPNA